MKLELFWNKLFLIQFYYYFIWMRPKQWIKNLIIFIPLLFSWFAFDLGAILNSMIVFLIFCIFAWSIYILNDIRDIEHDKNHPKKNKRPLASGKLNLNFALMLSLILISIALWSVYKLFDFWVLISFFIYLINTVIYIYFVKNIVIVDIFSISMWFVIRWLIWTFLIWSEISIWLLLILFFWALLLWFLKRFQELKLGLQTRKNITHYNEEFLKQIISMITTLILMSYSFYTFNSVQSKYIAVTIPFVIFGIIRFFYNIFYLEKFEHGIEEIILYDRYLLVNWLLYLITVFIVIYFDKIFVKV